MKTVKGKGKETTYFDSARNNYDEMSYLDDDHNYVEPEEATQFILKIVRAGKPPVYNYGRLVPEKRIN